MSRRLVLRSFSEGGSLGGIRSSSEAGSLIRFQVASCFLSHRAQPKANAGSFRWCDARFRHAVQFLLVCKTDAGANNSRFAN
jgi:hypothetical protein